MKKNKDILTKAVDVYGFDNQLNQLTEECGELIVACNKLRRRGDFAIPLMIDELADVKIMVEQITSAMDLHEEVEERIKFKIKRLSDELKNK